MVLVVQISNCHEKESPADDLASHCYHRNQPAAKARIIEHRMDGNSHDVISSCIT